MSKTKSKQLFGVLTTSGSQFVTGSITTTENITAPYFIGSGLYLTDVAATSSPWLISSNSLYTSQSFNVKITGSLEILGSGSNDLFLIKNNSSTILKVSSSGVIQFNIFANDPNGITENGQLYFTSSSLFISTT